MFPKIPPKTLSQIRGGQNIPPNEFEGGRVFSTILSLPVSCFTCVGIGELLRNAAFYGFLTGFIGLPVVVTGWCSFP